MIFHISQGFSSNRRIARQKTQEGYEKVYTSEEFVIDSRYSQVKNWKLFIFNL